MTVTVYGIRLRGANEFRYVGQTQQAVAERLRAHHSYCGCQPIPDGYALWMRAGIGEIEAVEICRFETVEEAKAAERAAIKTCIALGHRLFNFQHVPAALRAAPVLNATEQAHHAPPTVSVREAPGVAPTASGVVL